MWHASASSPFKDPGQLYCCVLDALDGVGDQSQEWTEYSGDTNVYHLRRRLTPEEQEYVGPVLDIRGTPEELERLSKIPGLPPGYRE